MPITTTTEENVGTPGHTIQPESEPPVACSAPCSPIRWRVIAADPETQSLSYLWGKGETEDAARHMAEAKVGRNEIIHESKRWDN